VPGLSPHNISSLAKLGAHIVGPGDVFLVLPPRARYFRSPKGRPALVVRVQRSPAGEATLAYLVYGTTKRVPKKRSLPAGAGEAGLERDTTFDFGPRLELPVDELLRECRPLGRFSADRLADLEAALAASRLPFKELSP
jgi:hypothetical protein